jgi:deoxyadenosine/deoxycytidine kinase
MSNSNFTIVSIEGNIGSGKTTLMTHLKEEYKNNPQVIFLKEPVDEWSLITDENGTTILQKFYENPEKYSFAFQMMAYVSRLNVLRQAIKELDPSKKYVFITERSLNTDRCVFAKMLYETDKMEEVCYKIYLMWFNSFSQEFPVHKIVYVKVDPNVCHVRISKRARAGEANIALNYLERCDKYHEYMMKENDATEKLILDGNVDIYENATQMADWLYKFNYFIR